MRQEALVFLIIPLPLPSHEPFGLFSTAKCNFFEWNGEKNSGASRFWEWNGEKNSQWNVEKPMGVEC